MCKAAPISHIVRGISGVLLYLYISIVRKQEIVELQLGGILTVRSIDSALP